MRGDIVGRTARLVGWSAAVTAALAALAGGVFAAGAERAVPERPAAATAPLPDAPNSVKNRRLYLERLTREAEAQKLPPAVADAVAFVESGYDSNARGSAGEIGLMQILPSTAAMLGHSGSPLDLLQPDTNIRYAVRYLAQAWHLTNGDLCRSLMKYRAGHGEERMTPLSVQYCARARAHLASIGSPLANAPVPVAVATLPLGPETGTKRTGPSLALRPVAPGPIRNRSVADSRRFWAAHEARIRAINTKLALRWRKTAEN